MLQPKTALGQSGEDRAAAFLTQHGYQVLDRNCRVGNQEIDIVAQELASNELVFVEVKTRRDYEHGWGSDAVDGRKLARMIRVAGVYRRLRGRHELYRFDIICVVGAHVDHYQNVTWNG